MGTRFVRHIHTTSACEIMNYLVTFINAVLQILHPNELSLYHSFKHIECLEAPTPPTYVNAFIPYKECLIEVIVGRSN